MTKTIPSLVTLETNHIKACKKYNDIKYMYYRSIECKDTESTYMLFLKLIEQQIKIDKLNLKIIKKYQPI